MKKYLFFLIIFISLPVFAQDYNVSSTITAPTGSSPGTYTATEIYNSGATSVYSINTRYSGQLSRIRFNIPLPNNWQDGDCFATGDLLYTLTLNMATNDWRNHFSRPFISSSSAGTNFATSNITFVSRKQIKFNFKIPNSDSCFDFLYVNLVSTDESDTAFTGETNWNLSSIILTTNFTGGSSGGSSSGSSPTPTPNNTQDIINNNNENTQQIIDNNSQNTQDIINNNNDNTQILNESINSNSINEINVQRSINLSNCTNAYDFNIKKGYRISNSNTLIPDENSYYTDGYVGIGSNVSKLYIQNPLNSTSGYLFIFYDSSNNIISYVSTRSQSLTVPSGAVYFRFASTSSNTYVFRETRCITSTDVAKDEIKQNQNENTQKEIESQKVCKQLNIDSSYIVDRNSYLNTNGSVSSNSSGWGITDYIPVSKMKVLSRSGNAPSTCFYKEDKTLISCISNNILPIGNYTLPANTYYFRASLPTDLTSPRFTITSCVNGNTAINDSITDSNIDSDSGSDFFDGFSNNMHGLSSIITLPLNSISSLSSSTCTPLQFPIPFTDNKYLTLPCMTEIYEEHIPTLLTLVQTIWLGIISYKILIDIFFTIKGFKDPDSDKIEVLDL